MHLPQHMAGGRAVRATRGGDHPTVRGAERVSRRQPEALRAHAAQDTRVYAVHR